MKHIFTLIILLLFQAKITEAQTIRVLNAQNRMPVSGVHIHWGKQNVISGDYGRANISAFPDTANLLFRHINYIPQKKSKAEIMKNDGKVYLQRKITDLNEVIVSASRWEQKKNEIPNKITTVTQSAINLENPQTAADLLELTGEVYIQKSQLGGGSPMIRGFATSRLLLVIDGVRMNNAIFRSGNLQNVISLDAHSIGNTEVIFGPGSVVYGSDAIGGVMDFHTERIPLLDEDAQEISENIILRHSTANAEKTVHADVTLSRKNWGMYTAVTYSDYGHLRTGSKSHPEYRREWVAKRIAGHDTMLTNPDPNIQRYSGYNQLNVLHKIRLQPTSRLNINYALHYSETSNLPRYDRLIVKQDNKPKYVKWYYGPQRWQMHSLSAEYKAGHKLFDNAKLTLAYQNYQESRHDRKFGEKFLRRRYEQVDIGTINLDMDKKSGQHAFYYGLEGVYNKVHSRAWLKDITTEARTPYASRYPDGAEYAYLSAYTAYKNSISNNITLNAGIRFNLHTLSAAFDTTFYPFPFQQMELQHSAVNGNIGLVYRSNDGLQLSGNLATGFKAPNVDDVGKVFDSEPGTVIVPNKNLQSEYAWNAELQIAKSWNNRHQVDAAVFYTILNNAMVRRDFTFNGRDTIMYDGQPSQVKALVNADQARVYGFQAGAKFNLYGNWFATGSINWMRGSTTDGTPLRHVAPAFGDAHIKYKENRLTLDFYADFNSKKPHSRMAPSELGKPHMYARNARGELYAPAWYTINAQALWQFNNDFQLTAGIENILDMRYRPYASGIAAPGRNFIIALRGFF